MNFPFVKNKAKTYSLDLRYTKKKKKKYRLYIYAVDKYNE